MAGERWKAWARSLTCLLAGALVLAACSGNVDLDTDDPEPGPSTSESAPEPERPIAEAKRPDAAYLLLASENAFELSTQVSRAYIDRAQVAVVAPADDRGATMRAASIGAAVGAPVLLSGAQGGELDIELVRLGVVGIVTVGAVDLTAIDTTSLVIAPAPADAAGVGDLFGIALSEVPLPAEGDDVAALLALGDGEIFATAPTGPTSEPTTDEPATEEPASDEPTTDEPASGEPSQEAPSQEAPSSTASATPEQTSAAPSAPADDEASDPTEAPTAVGELPPMAPTVTIANSLLVTDGEAAQLAAIATAAAAGAHVLRLGSDIRADAAAIETVHDLAPTSVVGLGTGLGTAEQFRWRTETAETGVQLPGGGQLVFNATRYVALYGSPATPSLGILGEQGVDETVTRAAEMAGEYTGLTDDTVVPALEIIVTVATGSAGDDGNYSNEWDPETFVPLIEAAQEAGQYVVLDFQPGRSTFLEQVRQYEQLLAYPNVGIALDPEWRLGPDELPLQQIGSVDVDEVNDVVTYLADFVQGRLLPQKLLVLHQFQLRMITDREFLETGRSEVALLIHADGQGTQPAKQATWQTLQEDAPAGVRWGWKNFIDEDEPMLTPEQTYSDVDPIPDFVSYQ